MYEQLYDGLKMEGALKEITIMLLKTSFVASKLQVLASWNELMHAQRFTNAHCVLNMCVVVLAVNRRF